MLRISSKCEEKKKSISKPSSFWSLRLMIEYDSFLPRPSLWPVCPCLRRTPCATTSVCTSALCAWRTWRGRCGRWMRWSTRNAGHRRSQGEDSTRITGRFHYSCMFQSLIPLLFSCLWCVQEPITCQEPALQSGLWNCTKRQLTGTCQLLQNLWLTGCLRLWLTGTTTAWLIDQLSDWMSELSVNNRAPHKCSHA